MEFVMWYLLSAYAITFCHCHQVEQMTVSATCDNLMKLYVDGHQVATSGRWTDTSTVSTPASSEVIGIECLDYGVVAGILASVSSGAVTGGDWRCSTHSQPGWARKGFSDNSWAPAFVIGGNGMSPWRQRPGISGSAQWIWTSGWRGSHRHVYCRLDLTAERPLIVQATCDNSMKLYADGQLVAANNVWEQTTTVSVSGQTRVIAIECVDRGVVGGILASLSSGVTSDSSWRCSHQLVSGWAGAEFDEGQWSHAYSIGMNGMAPWRTRPGIMQDAVWIWTLRSMWRGGHTHVYCRKTL